MPSIGEPARVIATTTPSERVPTYELRHGHIWASFNAMGDIRPVDGGERGLYHGGRRYLRRFELLVAQQPAVLLHSSLDENERCFVAELTNPDQYVRKWLIAPSGQLHIYRSMVLWQNHCFTRLVVENRSNATWRGDCTLGFDADFMRTTATSQAPRVYLGRRLPSVSRRNSVWFGHEDDNGARQQMRFDFTPTPADSSASVIWVVRELQAAEVITFDLTITCEPREDVAPALTFEQALTAARGAPSRPQ